MVDTGDTTRLPATQIMTGTDTGDDVASDQQFRPTGPTRCRSADGIDALPVSRRTKPTRDVARGYAASPVVGPTVCGMRVLHTSDWHVGRTFHGRDLLTEQDTVLRHIADVVAGERIDLVLIAGDLYDRAVPSAEAVVVCTEALRRIRAAGARIVLITGNHDSAPRVGSFAEFAAAGGLHIRNRLSDLDRPAVFEDEHGPVACYGIPYLEPDLVREGLGIPERRGHQAVLTVAMDRVRVDLAGRPGTRSIVLAHAFVIGGAASDSERRITVGGVEHVGAEVFHGVDYVALGHLHGPQVITERLRYAGSPLAYSFSEAGHRKSVWIVELDARGLSEVRRHELPVPRPLATLTATLNELLTGAEFEPLTGHFLSVNLTDPVRPIDAMRRLRVRFPHAVHLEWLPGEAVGADLRYREIVRGRSDQELADGFVADCRGARPNDVERVLLREALESIGDVPPEEATA